MCSERPDQQYTRQEDKEEGDNVEEAAHWKATMRALGRFRNLRLDVDEHEDGRAVDGRAYGAGQ